MGADVQKKIAYVYTEAKANGFTDNQAKLLLGLIDHESIGTWDENISNCGNPEKECSIGIAQWNKNAGRYAPETFEEQVALIIKEMKIKFDLHTDLIAITKHNCPACNYILPYTNKVITSSNLFN